MATIAVSITNIQRGTSKSAWTGFATSGDVGAAAALAGKPDKSVQVLGTFTGSPTIVIEGSNDGGTTYATLNDATGTALSFTAAGLKSILEHTELIRPRASAGTGGASVSVYIVAHGDR